MHAVHAQSLSVSTAGGITGTLLPAGSYEIESVCLEPSAFTASVILCKHAMLESGCLLRSSPFFSACLFMPYAGDNRNLPAGSYEIERFCLEPSAFLVREEGRDEFDPSKVLTRQTYTLDMVSGGGGRRPPRGGVDGEGGGQHLPGKGGGP